MTERVVRSAGESTHAGARSAEAAQRLEASAGRLDPYAPLEFDRASSQADSGAPPESPTRIFWRQLKKSPLAIVGGGVLIVFYLLALLAPFVAPYSEEEMDRRRYFHPPHDIHWIDAEGRFHLRPFVRQTRLANPSAFTYEEVPGADRPIRFFVRGAEYSLLGGLVRSNLHLFGVEDGDRIYLLGTDSFGRDEFSRLLYGGQVSLTVGLVGILISFSLGLLLGGISGYFGGFTDSAIMRTTELLLSIPSLYLIIALRAVFPIDLPSQQVYLGIVAILAFIGWAGLARVIRGLVLSIRRNEYVTAAEALGVSRFRIITRHILPNTWSFVIVAATISVPGYILGEVVLSFLGVGVQEPASSWGNMLNQARSIRALTSFPWLLYVPGLAIFLTVMAFNFLGDGLRDALDPRRVTGGRS
jgi:peptide/nickel transport system permease protein